ncbi:glycine betaine/L-proline ABC transporter substrate-binding protein ProX [Variovorax dokdonensis]|uniref:Glycine betaine/L-proline ABC transporter substrate-binding protein ProX n=1 Tax=Variovorax dokdonensis TaxID=344883 RepID=A0ABT7N8G2_9BURK|nr:glycine betaine/L-proline ABC transporter substrate-binding protein ProX [Variovorax dokdonensis]MDM0044217.1 glycine betaine/L-proline ABC transporter substrate-binding protein ProX [Variovorax dokdonensis]
MTIHTRSNLSSLRTLRSAVIAACLGALGATGALAADLPGKGITVMPVRSSLAEEAFQTQLVVRGLERLGYKVASTKEIEPATAHVAVANGDATFMANHWTGLHDAYYANTGGDAKLWHRGVYIRGAVQGYLIDRKTSEKHRIENVDQLRDPKIAALFDTDRDGKADLTGCTPGWGCELLIENHLTAYKLRDTVTHKQGNYPALMADTIQRYKAGKPILYYTWTPYWVSAELVPGKDVVWLQVPFSSSPGGKKVDTRLPNGKNYGTLPSEQWIVANKAFIDKNPAAAKLFSLMTLSISDINAQNLRMRAGEDKPADIARHADAWIAAHQKQFDDWVAQAKAASSAD